MTIKAFFAYNQGSEGASLLSKALGVPRIKHSGSSFVGGPHKTILNWGATTERYPTKLLNCNIINHPELVDNAVDKVKTFNKFREHNVSCPEFTSNRDEALSWLESDSMVFARTNVKSHSGRGIQIMDPEHPDTWEVTAPLYVKYIPKKHEYRVHVMKINGTYQVIDTQRKGLKEEFRGNTDVNFKIRNLQNGFIYVRNDGHVVPEVVRSVGISAVQSLQLDFGAADVIYNEQRGQAYSLEINSAPGITGTTVDSYVTALGNY